jgi:hypothetical protein
MTTAAALKKNCGCSRHHDRNDCRRLHYDHTGNGAAPSAAATGGRPDPFPTDCSTVER